MLSKTRYAQLAAVAALTVLFGANASTTTAQAQGNQPTQIEKTQEGQATRSGGQKTRDAGSARETSREGGSVRSSGTNREMRSDRSRDRTSTQTTTRRGTDSNRTRVTTRDRDWNRDNNHDRWRGHGHDSYAATFVVLGPRVVYRSYGSGWCRALHNGRHYAPHVGWHRGKHVGAVRCG